MEEITFKTIFALILNAPLFFWLYRHQNQFEFSYFILFVFSLIIFSTCYVSHLAINHLKNK